MEHDLLGMVELLAGYGALGAIAIYLALKDYRFNREMSRSFMGLSVVAQDLIRTLEELLRELRK